MANFVAKLKVKLLARHQRFSRIPSWLNHDATEFMKEMSLATSRAFLLGALVVFQVFDLSSPIQRLELKV